MPTMHEWLYENKELWEKREIFITIPSSSHISSVSISRSFMRKNIYSIGQCLDVFILWKISTGIFSIHFSNYLKFLPTFSFCCTKDNNFVFLATEVPSRSSLFVIVSFMVRKIEKICAPCWHLLFKRWAPFVYHCIYTKWKWTFSELFFASSK